MLTEASRSTAAMIGRTGLGEVADVARVGAFSQRRAQACQLIAVDVSLAESHLLRTGDPKSLPPLERGDEVGGLQEAVRRTGVQPGETAPHQFNRKLSLIEISPVDIGDFQAGRWLNVGRNIDDAVVIEIQSGNG